MVADAGAKGTRLFVLPNVDVLTDNWHSEGGLVVIAPDLDTAKEMVKRLHGTDRPNQTGDPEHEWGPTDEEWAEAVVYTLAEPVEPRVFVFPNAGCC